MKRLWVPGLILMLTCGCKQDPGEIKRVPPTTDVPKGVSLDGFHPAYKVDWTEKTPKLTVKDLRNEKMGISLNRHAIFELRAARAEGEEPAELVIFKGASGSVEKNVDRWKSQFADPKEVKIDDKFEIAGIPGTRVDIKGTFLKKERPMDPTEEPKELENRRMIAIYWEGPINTYQIKLLGTEKTVEMHLKEFDKWLKSFK